ncbi:MAG TPA: AMP-binding protein [Solirubrobacterales bacterium]
MSSPQTIPAALAGTSAGGVGEHVFHLEDGVVRLSLAELAERAQRGAQRLAALGVGPGDAVGVLGPNRPEWVISAFAAWTMGAVVVPVPLALRVRDPDAFREQLRRLVEAADCRRVLVDPRLAALLPAGVAAPWDEEGEESSQPLAEPVPSSPAVVQFTSGSTAAPKGALLTHAAVSAQMDILAHGYRHDEGSPRTVLSWTPFFHDLGLFGNLVQPAYTGSITHHLPTESFAKDPAAWLRLVGKTRVSVTVGPSSAFGSALKAAGRRGERIDLSSLEAAFFAAEGVDPEVSQGMVDTARQFGFHPEALGATYGLAEAVMAVSFPVLGTGLRLDRVSLPKLAREAVAVPVDEGQARLMVSTGRPYMDLRIAGSGGSVAERHLGEIQLRGPSSMSGYVGPGAPDPFVDGWLCTGDLGYLADGELYVAGRAKDMVIAMGHNYYPEDFEWAAARVDGIRPGRCIAFSLPGSERVVLLVEARDGDPEALRREVGWSVANAVGVAPSEVVILPAGALEKTTSGKLRRAAMRHAYSSGKLPTPSP